MTNAKQARRIPLVVERPPKPVDQMTDEEIDAYGAALADRMADSAKAKRKP